MKTIQLVMILAVPLSFIGGMGFTVLMLSHTPNPSSHVATTSNTTMSSSNGSAKAIVNPNTNRIYVANEVGHTVSVIDGNNNEKIADIPVDEMPFNLAVNPNTNRIYVIELPVFNNIEQNSTILMVDGINNTVIGKLYVGPYLQMAVNPDTGRIYVSENRNVNGSIQDGTVTVIDGNNDTLIGKPLFLYFGVEGIAVNPATNKTYVADGVTTTLYVIGNNTQKVQKIGGLSTWNVAVNPATNRIYVPSYFFNNLSVIDGKYDNIMKVIPIGKYPDTMNLK